MNSDVNGYMDINTSRYRLMAQVEREEREEQEADGMEWVMRNIDKVVMQFKFLRLTSNEP